MVYENIKNYIGDINTLTAEFSSDKKKYSSPNFYNAGSVSVVRVLEIIAPTVFRNSDSDITSASIGDIDVVCGKPNKTKHMDRSKGLRILRSLGLGGQYPQNRHSAKKANFLDNVDINSLVFGDSLAIEKNVLPVKAAFMYSDILSFSDYDDSVSSTVHINMGEREYYNFEKKENSPHLFERNVITPGTIMVQILTSNGRVAPKEFIDHLLMSIDEAGSYGGQTSVCGTNVKNHIVGIYGSKSESSVSSPYELVKLVREQVEDRNNLTDIIKTIHEIMSTRYQGVIDSKTITEHRDNLLAEFINDDTRLVEKYTHIKSLVDGYFGTYISNDKKGK